jgi:hypothetical protein
MESLNPAEKIVNDFLEHLRAYIPEYQQKVVIILEDLRSILEDDYNGTITDEYLEVLVECAVKKHIPEGKEMSFYVFKQCITELRNYRPEIHKFILSEAKKVIQPVIDKRRGIETHCEDFRKFLQRLDDKTKFIYLMLSEATCLTGVNIACLNDVLYEEIGKNSDSIFNSVKNNPEYMRNPDIVFLCGLYKSACQVQQDKIIR